MEKEPPLPRTMPVGVRPSKGKGEDAVLMLLGVLAAVGVTGLSFSGNKVGFELDRMAGDEALFSGSPDLSEPEEYAESFVAGGEARSNCSGCTEGLRPTPLMRFL